jgi:hypothetical protein
LGLLPRHDLHRWPETFADGSGDRIQGFESRYQLHSLQGPRTLKNGPDYFTTRKADAPELVCDVVLAVVYDVDVRRVGELPAERPHSEMALVREHHERLGKMTLKRFTEEQIIGVVKQAE